MAKKQVTVWTCDGCGDDFEGEQLVGMTATIKVTSQHTHSYQKSGDFCPGCLETREAMLRKFFDQVLSPVP